MAETKTEKITRALLAKNKVVDGENGIKIYEKAEVNENPIIRKLLKQASKSPGGEGAGYPEFVIINSNFKEFLIVIECKDKVTFHESEKRDKPDKYAVDGAIHYAAHLSKTYDVVSIGISGNEEKNIKISSNLFLKNGFQKDLDIDQIIPFEDLYKIYITDDSKLVQDLQSLKTFSKKLNDELYDQKVPADKRSFIISGCLISLKNQAFKDAYMKYKTTSQLIEAMLSAIKNVLSDRKVEKDRIHIILREFNFLKSLEFENELFLNNIINQIYEKVDNFQKTHKDYDVLGEFYTEFLKYFNSDKALGIVLTPKHITQLFCELLELTKNDVVYDNCCGSGSFLISAMGHVLKQLKTENEKEKTKKNNFIGTEEQSHLFAIATCNMVLHDDGVTKIFKNNCFKNVDDIKKLKPTAGFLNPPFRKKTVATSKYELEYVLNNLECLAKNSLCLALLPMSAILYNKGDGLEWKKKLLKNHTLKAVCSLPDNIFYEADAGTVTCVMIVEAHKPHNSNFPTYLGYWKNDGFEEGKFGRVDTGEWSSIKNKWITSFRSMNENKLFNPNDKQNIFSVKTNLKAEDEWCAEAYLKTDYNLIDKKEFEKSLKDYFLYKINRPE